MKYILEICYDEPDETSTMAEDLDHLVLLTMCKEFVSAVGDLTSNVTLYLGDEEDEWEVVKKVKKDE